jgi:hypothetical protein
MVWLNGKGPKKGHQIKAPEEYARITDVYPKGVLFKADSKAGDVVQGELSDCWLLGGCSAVLTGGLSLKELFVAYSEKWGVYCVRFFVEGDWCLCTVDDYIPVDANKKPIYGHNKGDDEFWVPILEKAFANLYGSYEGIHFGYEHYAMESLTGGVCASVNIATTDDKKQQDIFKKLKERCEEGDAFAVAVKEDETKAPSAELKEEKRADGLISGHAYGLMGMVEHKGVQLLQLRNPWGSDEWKGAWSHGSKEWTDDMKAACKEGKEHDQGTFWISRQDFFKNYGSVQGVRNFDKDYKCTATYSSVAGDNKKTQDVSFAILPETKANEVIFVMAQRDARLRSGGKNDDYFVELGFDIYKTEGAPDAIYEDEPEVKPVIFHTEKYSANRSITATVALNPQHGYYIVPHVKIPADLKATKKHVNVFLRCYSKTKVELDEMGYKEDLDEEEEEEDDEEEEETCAKCAKKQAKIDALKEIIKEKNQEIDELNDQIEDDEEEEDE